MANGRLQCVGSPYFLKRHYGVGYTLVIVKADGFDVDTCTEIIRRYIPGITPKDDRGMFLFGHLILKTYSSIVHVKEY